MKSIFESIVFGSTLLALAAGLTGCGDDDERRFVRAGLRQGRGRQVQERSGLHGHVQQRQGHDADGLRKSYNAVASCYAGAKFTCDNNEESVAKECNKQESAYAECLQSGGKDDGDKDGGGGNDNGGKGGSGGK